MQWGGDPMKLFIFKTAQEADACASQLVREQLRVKEDSVFCFAGGNTTKSIHQKIAEDFCGEPEAFGHAQAFVLDEYWGVPPSDPAGVAGRLKAQILDRVGFPPENIHLFDMDAPDAEQACRAYDRKWFANTIDLAFLGLGENGHLGFNEPGTAFGLTAHKVALSEETRRSKSATFGGYEKVPAFGITVGIKNILAAKHLILAVKGPAKREMVCRALLGAVTEQVPASALQLHPHVTVILDEEAASGLPDKETLWTEQSWMDIST